MRGQARVKTRLSEQTRANKSDRPVAKIQNTGKYPEKTGE